MLTWGLRSQGRGTLASISFVLGLVASLAANVAAVEPTMEARIAAWPPITLLLAWELLMQTLGLNRRASTPQPPERMPDDWLAGWMRSSASSSLKLQLLGLPATFVARVSRSMLCSGT